MSKGKDKEKLVAQLTQITKKQVTFMCDNYRIKDIYDLLMKCKKVLMKDLIA